MFFGRFSSGSSARCSTSTATLDWVEASDLENQLKVTALSIARIMGPIIGDINYDGKMDMKDIGYAARRFGMNATDPLWDSGADIVGDGRIDMEDIDTAARHFGEVDS